MLLKEPVVPYETLYDENNKASQPFTAEALLQCWNAYAETLEDKVHLKNTMINCKPVLLSEHHFELVVHNPGQRDAVLNHSVALLRTLRAQLKNSQIQLNVRIDETNEKKLAFTATEKYEYLNTVNPLLSTLRDAFDLTLD